MATQLPKFRGFRSTSIQQPTTSTSGGYGSTPKQPISIPTVEPKKKKDGFFTSLAKGIVKPAVDYTKFVGEAALQGGRALLDPQMRKATFNPGAMTEDDWIKLGQKKGSFLVDEKDIKDRGTIAKTGLKRTAGAATYAIPGSVGAKGVIGVARAGALSGGLYGLYEGDDIDPGRIFTNAATGAVAAPAMYLGGKALNKVGGKVVYGIKNTKSKFSGTKKIGEFLEEEGKNFRTRGIGNPVKQQQLEKKYGKSVGDFLEQYQLLGRDPGDAEAVRKAIGRKYDSLATSTKNKVNVGKVIKAFDDDIYKFSSGVNGVVSDADKSMVSELVKRKNQFLESIGATYHSPVKPIKRLVVGDDGVLKTITEQAPKELRERFLSAVPLETDTATATNFRRKVIDPDVPSSQFGLDARGSGTARGTKKSRDILRTSINSTDKNLERLGLDYGMSTGIQDILEKAQARSNNRQPMNFTKLGSAGVGGLLGGIPGAVGGFVAEQAANSPQGVKVISNSMRAAGKVLQNTPNFISMPSIPNVASRIPGNVSRNATINSINAGVNNLMDRPPEAQASRQEVVMALSQQGILDPVEISQMINEAAQRQGMTPDFTPEEVQQYLGGSGGQPTQMPKFRGFRQ